MDKIRKVPDKGDLLWVNLNPTRGHEQSGYRPVLVLSPKRLNKNTGQVIVCPVTSTVRGYPTEVLIETKEISGAVLVNQVCTLDTKAREIRMAGKVSATKLRQVCDIFMAMMDW